MRLRGAHARRKTRIERSTKRIARLMQNNDEYLAMYRRLKHTSEHVVFARGSGKTSPLLIMGCFVHSSKYLGRNWRKRKRVAK